MYVLGFDIGMTKDAPAAGVVIESTTTGFILRTCQVFVPDMTQSYEARIAAMAYTAWPLFITYRAQLALVGFETAHFARNQQTMRKLAEAGGAIRGLAALAEVPCYAVAASVAKKALTQYGASDKLAMIEQVRFVFGPSLTGFDTRHASHVADACGVALGALVLHAHVQPVKTNGKKSRAGMQSITTSSYSTS